MNKEFTLSFIFITLFTNNIYAYNANNDCENLLKNGDNKKAIIACGGGLPAHNNNIEYLKHKGIVIYLKASTETLIKRLEKNKNKRPLISNLTNEERLEFIRKILKEREKTYKQADYTIETDNKTVKEVLREINSLLLTI